MEDIIYEFCASKYNEIYRGSKERLEHEALASSRNGIITEAKIEDIEKDAQLEAIKDTMIDGRTLFPSYIPVLWASIYKAHLYRKSGICDPLIVDRAIKAEQSWRASSGHAFESMVTELATLALRGTRNNLRFILQKDLNTLLKAGELANQPTDLAWLKEKVKGSVFDIYVVADIVKKNQTTDEEEVKTVCFGCVQCKTSIRDRVSRDIVPSKEAMESKFWSIGFVLDGTMFSVPKYHDMVNGNPATEFKRNGWHGIYVLSYDENDDRIYGIDMDFNVVREHTIKAFETWHYDRMGFDIDWRAESYTNSTIPIAAEPSAIY